METLPFQDYINEVVARWARQLEQKLLAAMLSEGLIDSGALRQSLKAKVFGMVNNATSEMQLSFNSYGRILDMKKSKPLPTHTNAHNRAAFGTDRTLKNRGRTWYNTTWYRETDSLITDLMGDVSRFSHQEFINWLKPQS